MKKTKQLKEQKAKNRFVILTTLLALFLVSTILLNVYFYLSKPILEQEINVHFTVDDYFGLQIKSEDLDYGVIPPGNSVDKYLFLENKYDYPVIIKVMISRELEGFIYGSREITIEPGSVRKYAVSLNVPIGTEYGNYSGTILLETFPAE